MSDTPNLDNVLDEDWWLGDSSRDLSSPDVARTVAAARLELHTLRRGRDAMERALRWIGRGATREDFEQGWNSVQDVACAALAGIDARHVSLSARRALGLSGAGNEGEKTDG